jgi:hypothetical protein
MYLKKLLFRLLFHISDTGIIRERHRWSTAEKRAIERQFKEFLRSGKIPGHLACINAIAKEPVLSKHKWSKLKNAVRNMVTVVSQKRRKYSV